LDERPETTRDRSNRRILFLGLAVFILVLLTWSLPAGSARPTRAQGDAPFPPQGTWTTIANGDDVIALATEDDHVWAGTRGGGLVRWSPSDGTFVQFLKPQDPLASNTIRDIYIDPDGHKWLATNHGLSILDDHGTADKADDTWYNYTMATTAGNLPSNRVSAVAVDDQGFLWIGLEQYWDDHAQVLVDPGRPNASTPIPPEYVEAPAYTGGGLVKVDTKGNLDPGDDEWLQHYTVNNTAQCDPVRQVVTLGLASDNVRDILPMPNGRIWVGTDRHHAYSLAANSNPCVYFVADPNEPGTWVQIFGGLSVLDQQATETTDDDTWKTWNCENSTDFSCSVHQVEHDRQDFVWALMGGRGIVALRWQFPDLDYEKFDEDDGLPSDDIDAFIFGPSDQPQWQNTVWFSTYSRYSGRGSGVTLLDHKGTVLDENDDTWNPADRVPNLPLTTENGLPDNRVQAMALGNNQIWMGMGGVYGGKHGVIAFDLGSKALQHHLTTGSVGLPYNYIQDLKLGEPGTRWANRLWVGTGNNRERRYGIGALVSSDLGADEGPLPDLTWTQFTKEGTDDNGRSPWTGLGSNNVTSLAVDGNNVWFGTQPVVPDEDYWGEWDDGGVSVYDGDRWTRRTDQNTGGQFAGMFDDKVSNVAVGCENDIWIALSKLRDSSGIGINVLDPHGAPHSLDNDTWEYFKYPDIPSNLVTDIAADCDRQQMWIATAPYFNGYYTGGGGVARYQYGAASARAAWTRWTTDNSDLMSWAIDHATGDVQSIAVASDGTVWAGASGDETVGRTEMLGWPFIPAAINWFQSDAWSNQVFPRDGWVSSIALDKYGAVWVATSRGGMDWAPPNGKEDDHQPDKAPGGLKLTIDGTQWETWEPENSGLPTDDITVLEVAPNGDIWAGTYGWGLLHFRSRDPSAPTFTPTSTATITLTPSTTPVLTWTPTPTATVTVTLTPFATAAGESPTPPHGIQRVFVPLVARNWRSRPSDVPTPATSTVTPTSTATPRTSPTSTGTPPPTATATATDTGPTPTLTATAAASDTPTPTPTGTTTSTPTPTSTITPTPGEAPPGVWCAPDSSDPACAEAQINLFTTRNLYDIEFSSDTHGYIVGEGGFIAVTKDGGNTWTTRDWGTQDLHDIAIVDDQVAWVSGDSLALLRTTDGGDWFERLSQFAPDMLGHDDEDYWAVSALSDTEAWALGHEYGSIVKWNPQQQRWDFDISNRFTGLPFIGAAVLSPTEGWAITDGTGIGAGGRIYRYNGTWSEAATKVASANLRRIEFVSPSLGWAIGADGTVMTYRDGQWSETSISSVWGDGGLTGLHIVNASDVWASGILGYGDHKDGGIYRYQGQSWRSVVELLFTPLNGIWVSSTLSNGWAIGDEGTLLRYVIPPPG
jgi:photosystem II stability/assembly factor-like uncharacterized protein/ligand-binding sensor domain-containing protein